MGTKNKLCEWTFDEDDFEYTSECGETILGEVSPDEYGFNHCPFCGLHLIVADDDD